MLEKSSKMPHERMLNLFDVLEDWLEAPDINAGLNDSLIGNNHRLQKFLANEAAKAGAAMPDMLANQLYLMAFAVMQDNLTYHQQNRLSDTITQNITYNMRHAKSAARALIVAQTRFEIRFEKRKRR